jgi:signal transduction histidine kinase
MRSLGEAAANLPWLSPCAPSLLALARSPLSSIWPLVRTDPGMAIVVARAWADRPVSFAPRSCDLKVIRQSVRYLRTARGTGFVNWAEPACDAVYRSALRQAHLASAMAGMVADCDPHRAWVGGMLASLGWLAAAATDPVELRTLLDDGIRHGSSCAHRHGFNAAAVGRRLGRRWRLPAWQRTIAGHLGLSADVAARLGADRVLFQVVQLAVLLRLREIPEPSIAVGASWGELLASLGLSVDQAEEAAHVASLPLPDTRWESPASQPLLIDLLVLAQGNRKQENRGLIDRLNGDIDRLHEALEANRVEEARRLRALKLAALAEFAAGAGHEINNPLAVISGQAQYLMKRLEVFDGPTEEIDNPAAYVANLKDQLGPSLLKIVGQAQRIHGILTDLMQFARPPAPKAQAIRVRDLVEEVAAELQGLANEKNVRLICAAPSEPTAIQGDPGQVRTALSALVRNAIEAALPGGWAGVRLDQADTKQLVLAVEDSGPGPGALAREHLFDPFFSGRSAGRGRGMGLPTAWRLACQQNGDLQFNGTTAGVTRFSLILPAATDPPVPAYSNGHNGAGRHDQ